MEKISQTDFDNMIESIYLQMVLINPLYHKSTIKGKVEQILNREGYEVEKQQINPFFGTPLRNIDTTIKNAGLQQSALNLSMKTMYENQRQQQLSNIKYQYQQAREQISYDAQMRNLIYAQQQAEAYKEIIRAS